MVKHAKLEEETRILLNRARAIILHNNPDMRQCTDDLTIKAALEMFVNGGPKK